MLGKLYEAITTHLKYLPGRSQSQDNPAAMPSSREVQINNSLSMFILFFSSCKLVKTQHGMQESPVRGESSAEGWAGALLNTCPHTRVINLNLHREGELGTPVKDGTKI